MPEYSVNLPAVSTLGTLLTTIERNAARGFVFVENQSSSLVTVVGDDVLGESIWYRRLTGVAANQQGADWSSSLFRGRVRVYGVAGSPVSAGEF